jgi:glutathione S-transferase/alpha,alpha-trehalase
VLWESGSILLHLAAKHDVSFKPAHQNWVVWANSSLDPVCFTENARGQVVGTGLGDARGRLVATLEALLEERGGGYLEGGFGVADVAVASYLNYVPLFSQTADLSRTPSIVRYMKKCGERPAFRRAFGDGHADLVQRKCGEFLEGGGQGFKLPKLPKLF